MAKVSYNDFEPFILDIQELIDMPEDVLDKMLEAKADQTVKSQKAYITWYRIHKTGKLRKSITAGKPRKGSNNRYLIISPRGTHHKNKNGTKVSNSELGAIFEFGTRYIKKRPWAADGNEEAADRAYRAAYDVYDEYLKSKNL